MFKTIILLLGFLMIPMAQADISAVSVSSYLAHLRNLPDKALVDYMERRGGFGSCQLSSMRLIPAASYKYKIVAPHSEVIAISPAAALQGISPVIGLSKPTTAAASLKTMRAHFNVVRGEVANLVSLDSITANLIRSRFLTSSNPCGITNNNIPGVGNKSILDIKPEDVTFYSSMTRKNAIRCKTKLLSARIYNNTSCSFEQKEKPLPESFCTTLYNRFKKSNVPSISSSVSLLAYTPTIAKEFATLALASANSLAVEAASTKTDLIAAMPIKELAQVEFLDSVSTCSSVSGCDTGKLQSVAAAIKYADSTYAVDPSLKTLANATSVISAQAAPLQASVLASKTVLATNLDAQLDTIAVGYGAPKASFTSFTAKLASPCAQLQLATTAALPSSL